MKWRCIEIRWPSVWDNCRQKGKKTNSRRSKCYRIWWTLIALTYAMLVGRSKNVNWLHCGRQQMIDCLLFQYFLHSSVYMFYAPILYTVCLCLFCRQTKLIKRCHSFLVKPIHFHQKVLFSMFYVCSPCVYYWQFFCKIKITVVYGQRFSYSCVAEDKLTKSWKMQLCLA